MNLFSFAVIIFSLIYVPAYAQSELEMENQRLKDRIGNLEKNLNMLQKEFYRDGGKPLSRRKSSSEGDPKLGIQAEEMDERLRAMNGRIEEAEHKVDSFAEKLDKIIEDIDFRISHLEGSGSVTSPRNQNNGDLRDIDASTNKNASITEGLFEDENIIGIVDKTKYPDDADSKSYDKAFAFMREAKYEEAERELSKYISQNNNKQDSKAGEAYYWLGETFYVRENFQQAALNFMKGYKEFPNGKKVSDSLYKLALSLNKLNKSKEACTTLNKYIKEFPDLFEKSKDKIASDKADMGCKS